MKYFETPEFKAQQAEWYEKLKGEGFKDIEGGHENARYTDHKTFSLNAAKGRPIMTKPGRARGSEWESILSRQDRHVDARYAPVGRYIHAAQLIAAQEYALCRLGVFREAGEVRAVWSLHAQGTSERDIAKLLTLPRYRIRAHIALLQDIINHALDAEADNC